MKKLILLCLVVCFANLNCKKEITVGVKEMPMKAYSPEEIENAVIYEVNIRQYSAEGTLSAFTQDIPQLKELGVKVLWVMPIQPVSMVRRKATGDKSIEDIQDPEERKKYLGSYYALADYTAVNPDYGTLEDFKNLVEVAHENGMYVILDWVANHTGWDHKWIKEHPEFYHKNAQGEVTDPLNPETGESWGWTDVAHLKYEDPKLYDAMANEMLFWVREANIDGFRCDVADNVKLDFWEFVYPKLNAEKPVFMLAESNKTELLSTVFDMGYNWPIHHLMTEIAQGKKNVADFDKLMSEQDSIFTPEMILMNFTSNHDENAWQGSEYERLGDGVEAFAALTYMLPGMPLIYNGQEYDFNRRLKFFEKDSLTHTKGKMWPIYAKLGQLKKENQALNGGKKKASYERISTSNDPHILAFKRAKNGSQVYFLANLSGLKQKLKVPITGRFENYMKQNTVEFSTEQELELSPWEYYILIPQ